MAVAGVVVAALLVSPAAVGAASARMSSAPAPSSTPGFSHPSVLPRAVGAVGRLGGADASLTSISVSRAAFSGTAPVVYLASAGSVSDAVSGGMLTRGPVLLMPRCGGGLASVRAEVQRLRPARVIAVGASSGVCDTDLRAVAGGVVTSRLSGTTRYDVAVAVSRHQFPAPVRRVYLANGVSLAEAAAAGVLSDGPVLLVPAKGVPAGVRAEITRLRPKEVVALGPTSMVPDATLFDLSGAGGRDRIEGVDRVGTAAWISAQVFESDAPNVYLANASTLVGAASAAMLTDGPVLLVPGCAGVPAAVREMLSRHQRARVVAIGDTGQVCDATVTAAADPASRAGATVQLSKNAAGQVVPGGFGFSDLSTDGRWAVFLSDAPLVPGDTNGALDVYLRDLTANTVTRVSAGPGLVGELIEVQGDVQVEESTPQISADGRYTFFTSGRPQLPGLKHPDRWHVYRYDRITRTLRVLAGEETSAQNPPEIRYGITAVSDDGRDLLITSDLTDLAPGASAVPGNYLLDSTTGTLRHAIPTTQTGGRALTDDAWFDLQRDGNALLIGTRSDDLTRDGRGGGLFERPLTGTAFTRITLPRGTIPFDFSADVDGRMIAFSTEKSLLAADTNRAADIYLLNRTTGRLGLISVPNGRPSCTTATGLPQAALPGASRPVISADGLSIAFESDCPELTASTAHRGYNLFVRNLGAHLTRGVDLGPDGRVTPQGIGNSEDLTLPVAISGDGSRVLFATWTDQVFPSTPTTTTPSLILRTAKRVSVSTPGPGRRPSPT